MSTIKKWLRLKHNPDKLEARKDSEVVQLLLGLWSQLWLSEDGLLMFRTESGDGQGKDLPVIPDALVEGAIRSTHVELSHRGPEPVCQFLRDRVCFPRMLIRTKEVVKRCNQWQIKTRPTSRGQQKVLIPHLRGQPQDTISVDFVGPLPPSYPGGYHYLLTVKDTFTRWFEAYPCRGMSSEVVISKLS